MSTGTPKKGMVTAVLLLVSGVLGIAILVTDKNLWTYQPTHAYGLIAFVVIDLGLTGLVLMRGTKSILRVAAIWGGLQALIMVGDIFWPSPFGPYPVSTTDFAKYLFGLGLYDNQHMAYLFPALFVAQLAIVLVAFMESRKASG